MIKLLQVTLASVRSMTPGSFETEEVSIKKFDAFGVIEYIAETFGDKVVPADLFIDESHDEYISVKVGDVTDYYNGPTPIEVLYIGKRQDYTGELMS